MKTLTAMKKILPLTILLITIALSFKAIAQDKNETTYFFIEDLTSKSYSKLIANMNSSMRSAITYTCVPAKIIAISNINISLFKKEIASTHNKVTQIELSQKEAEAKCAAQRQH